MRLSDSTGREQVRLLKFLTERNRRKAVAPHLVGNVAGYTWTGGEATDRRTGRLRYEPVRMNTYSLRVDYDSLRRRVGYVQVSWEPEGIWRGLPKDAVYLLDGKFVPGAVLRFIEGLSCSTVILRRLTHGWRCVRPMPSRQAPRSRCTTIIFYRPRPFGSTGLGDATAPFTSTLRSERRLSAPLHFEFLSGVACPAG